MQYTKEQVARAYVLMECERSGDNPNTDWYLKNGFITEGQRDLYNVSGTEFGPAKSLFMHIFWCWELDNPAPEGKQWGIGTMRCMPELYDIQTEAA